MSVDLVIPENQADWLRDPGLQGLFDVLENDKGEARVVGGAVRNCLMGEAIGDVDISTNLTPEEVLDRLKAAGIKAIATGLAHGTVTAVIQKIPYEITTLRRDIVTDGRHAQVVFSQDWEEDARRRDLTINALYCDRDGKIFDPLGGYDDIKTRTVRFIGDAGERIREDYLRILRFFRFFAFYGSGRPDADGLRACAREKDGISQLSAERVWEELKKILGARDPGRALLWMRTTGVLSSVLPESEKWGIDFFSPMIEAENDLSWGVDVLARLQVILPPTHERVDGVAKRLRFSKNERMRMERWVDAQLPPSQLDETGLNKMLYRAGLQGTADRIRNEIVRQRSRAPEDNGALLEAQKYVELLKLSLEWVRPEFCVRGKDLEKVGVAPGKEMGELLARLEHEWIESGFSLGKEQLLKTI